MKEPVIFPNIGGGTEMTAVIDGKITAGHFVSDELLKELHQGWEKLKTAINEKTKEKNRMNDLMVFNYESNEIRTVVINGEPWWVAKDVCDLFGETNRNRAMQGLDADEKGYTQMDTPGGKQEMAIINESGLYSMLFAMQPTKARGVNDGYIERREKELKAFKRWVTHEVLPSIRRTGGYGPPAATYPPKASSVKEIVELGRFMRTLMKDQNATPHEIAGVVADTMRQFGVGMSEKLVLPIRAPSLDAVRDDELDMVEFAMTFPDSSYQDYMLYRATMKSSR